MVFRDRARRVYMATCQVRPQLLQLYVMSVGTGQRLSCCQRHNLEEHGIGWERSPLLMSLLKHVRISWDLI